MSDWLTATVSNKLNGAEIFQGTYSINGTNADLIVDGRIIQCYVDENRANSVYGFIMQNFCNRQYDRSKAEPIFNDIRKSVLNKYDSGTERSLLLRHGKTQSFSETSYPFAVSFSSLVDTLANVKIERRILEFFGGKRDLF